MVYKVGVQPLSQEPIDDSPTVGVGVLSLISYLGIFRLVATQACKASGWSVSLLTSSC